jgi:hypothetical protein
VKPLAIPLALLATPAIALDALLWVAVSTDGSAAVSIVYARKLSQAEIAALQERLALVPVIGGKFSREDKASRSGEPESTSIYYLTTGIYNPKTAMVDPAPLVTAIAAETQVRLVISGPKAVTLSGPDSYEDDKVSLKRIGHIGRGRPLEYEVLIRDHNATRYNLEALKVRMRTEEKTTAKSEGALPLALMAGGATFCVIVGLLLWRRHRVARE